MHARGDDGDPLAGLALAAALASGWPRLVAVAAEESAILEAARAVEAALGPAPHGELLEPWAESDPWMLRVSAPGLQLPAWRALLAALPVGVEARLEPAASEAAIAAEDLGLRVVETLEAAGVVAERWSDRDGGRLWPDLARAPRADDEFQALGAELSSALQEAHAAFRLETEQPGSTGADAVVDRDTGRLGALLSFGPGAFDDASPEGWRDLRVRALAAVAGVIRARARHPRVRLAPDVRWDDGTSGLVLLLWLVAPPAPTRLLPRFDAPDPPDAVARLVAAGSGEVVVVPASTRLHAEVVARVAPLLEAGGESFAPGAPVWVAGPEGPIYAATWRWEGPVDLTGAEALRAVDGVAAVGFRPIATPAEDPFEAEITRIGRWWTVRRRCGLRARDLLDRVDPAAETDVDAALKARLAGVGGAYLAIAEGGRRGLEVDGAEPEAVAARLPEAGFEPALEVARLGARTVVRAWWLGDA